jgi:hypothetical protein
MSVDLNFLVEGLHLKRMREQARQQGEGASVWKTGAVTQRVWAHFWMPSAPAKPELEPPASP